MAPLILGAILGSYGWQETTEGKIDQMPEAISALHVSITLLPAAVLGLAIAVLVLVYRRSLANVESASLSEQQ